jgi:hypothetical protein
MYSFAYFDLYLIRQQRKTKYSEMNGSNYFFNLLSFSFKITTSLLVLSLQSSYSYVEYTFFPRAHNFGLKIEAAGSYPSDFHFFLLFKRSYITLFDIPEVGARLLLWISNELAAR